ncbi:MAG: serine protease, partial [Candidatus Poribacteria bacterium]|nr:serine protease [Candidatus Poribacteria bacterium]
GFFVRPNQVATDFHVVDGSTLNEVKPVRRRLHSADESLPAQLLESDKARNLALIHVETAYAPTLPIGDSDTIQAGDQIRIFNNSSVSSGEFSEGTISRNRFMGGVQYFEIDALVEPGSAGGPIVDSSGEVVAVTALKVPELDGSLNFAIPSKYLTEFLEAKGDSASTPSPSPNVNISPKPDPYADASPYAQWLLRGIERYEHAEFEEANRLLESALGGLTHPANRARAHLYLGCSKWGRGDPQESIIAEFQEALSHNPNIELPPQVGQNHPVFSPLLEKTRKQTTGTLTVNASPPHTQIAILGSRGHIIKEGVGSVNHCRLFEGEYTVTCTVGEASDLRTVSIVPGVHHLLDREIAKTPAATSRELTVELVRAAKPYRVDVQYEIYGTSGQVLDRGVLQMQPQGTKTDLGAWVYHVKWPPSTPAGELEYRINVDGEDMLSNPPPGIVILEPSDDAWIYTNHSIKLKAEVNSDISIDTVFVHYDDDGWMELETTGTPEIYVGTIPRSDVRAAGTFSYYVAAADTEGNVLRSDVRSVTIRRREDSPITSVVSPPEVSVLTPPGAAVFPTRDPISIEAEVKADGPIKEVRLYYNSVRKQLSDTSPSKTLENKSSYTYTGKIPKEHNQKPGYIWYFVAATTGTGMQSKTEDRMIETKEPTTQEHRGIWASHSWSNLAADDGFYSGWERGDVLSLAFVREGRGLDVLAAQLDYTYENPDYINAMLQ